jgi:hypothetical protein
VTGARLAAFVLFVCAAFAWVPPHLDRPGLAALGLAFLALTVGRVPVASRPTTPLVRGPALFDPEPLEPVPSSLERALAGYGLTRRDELDSD